MARTHHRISMRVTHNNQLDIISLEKKIYHLSLSLSLKEIAPHSDLGTHRMTHTQERTVNPGLHWATAHRTHLLCAYIFIYIMLCTCRRRRAMRHNFRPNDFSPLILICPFTPNRRAKHINHWLYARVDKHRHTNTHRVTRARDAPKENRKTRPRNESHRPENKCETHQSCVCFSSVLCSRGCLFARVLLVECISFLGRPKCGAAATKRRRPVVDWCVKTRTFRGRVRLESIFHDDKTATCITRW